VAEIRTDLELKVFLRSPEGKNSENGEPIGPAPFGMLEKRRI